MHLFIEARQSLTAMDAVLGKLARAMGLTQQELWAFMLMVAANEPITASWLAVQSGRARQQLHRALQRLGTLGLAEGVGHGTNLLRWSLTARGLEEGKRLRAVLVEWEKLIALRVDVPRLSVELQCMVAALVNQPRAGAWVNGVAVPYAVRSGAVRLDAGPSDCPDAEHQS
jgi:hypothetical protein